MRHGAHSERELLSPGMRVLTRGQEWLVDKVEPNSLGNHAVSCTGISALVRDVTATFLDDLDTITPVDPVKTRFIPDTSARAAKSHLFIESLLRATAPTDARIHVGNKAAMDSLPYQLVPAKKALAQPRQRILIADAVGLGKTLEAGILMAELIKRRNHVLYEMYTQGYITEAEFNAAKAETVTLTEKTSTTENATRSSSNSWFTDALYTQLLSQLQEDLNYTADEAKELIFSGGLRIYSTVDPTVQAGIEKTMYNEDDLIPALWHEEPVCLRDYPADSSSWDEVQYDEATGLPITKDGYAVYGQEAIPVYADDEGTTLKTGTSTDPDYPNDTTVYLCVYEKVRTQAAMATLDYDGNILGIGGGIGEKKYDLGFNRATSPHQTGSTMKPIGAYALALDYKLINYSSQILDSPYYLAEDKKVLKDQYIGVMSPFSEAAQSRSDVWRAWPTNYGGVGGQGNPMLIYDALQQSYNTVAVWVGDMVGVDYLYNFVHDTLECSYISAENDMDLGPLVLGSQSNGLTVVQLAGAYTMFNTGSYTTPHYYTEVTDYQGNMILDNNKYINTTQAISADTAYIMNRMMWNVLHSPKGTAYGKAPDGEMDSVAKTGTTSNYKDYTFAGLTPYYVTAIWWGCDRPTEMDTLGKAGKNASPIQYAWKALMEDLQADLPVKEFAKGENVVEKHFDTSTGAIISGGGAVGYYTEDNLPDSSYTVTNEEDPFAALAQAAAEAAAGAE